MEIPRAGIEHERLSVTEGVLLRSNWHVILKKSIEIMETLDTRDVEWLQSSFCIMKQLWKKFNLTS